MELLSQETYLDGFQKDVRFDWLLKNTIQSELGEVGVGNETVSHGAEHI